MTYQLYTIPMGVIHGVPFDRVNCFRQGTQSPRVGGKLKLQGLPYVKLFGEYRAFNVQPADVYSFPANPFATVTSFPNWWSNFVALDSANYQKFRSKLYQGGASLGVSLASYRQSREMIIRKYAQLNKLADKSLTTLQRELEAYYQRIGHGRYGRARKYWRRAVANFHLEVIFGWVPLVQDIHASATSVIQGADARSWITAKSQNTDVATSGSPTLLYHLVRTQRMTLTRSAAVEIRNPNRWLLERAGLLNPATVAWDLVPWSFVVNMFVNTNQLVQSMTDFAGLGFVNATTTTTTEEWTSRSVRSSFASSYTIHKDRVMDIDYTFRPVFKLPKLDWSLVATSASLFTQKLSAISRLVKSA